MANTPSTSPAQGAPNPARRKEDRLEKATALFLSAFEPVLVEDTGGHAFDGCIPRTIMRKMWLWIARDIAPDFAEILCEADAGALGATAALDQQLPGIITAIKNAEAQSRGKPDGPRKFASQMGGEEVYKWLEIALNIIKCRPIFAKAVSFGKNGNALKDDAALAVALKGLPLSSPKTSSVLFHVIVGQTTHPSRLVSAALELIGNPSEAAVRREGFAPLIEALLAHAQNQASLIGKQRGVFSDVDLICAGISRFHRLLRAVTVYLELEQSGRWSNIAREVTRAMGAQIEPRLRQVSADVAQALRRPRDGIDRLDADGLLIALNGVYLLAAVRDARESMALNALFEKIWAETGQNLDTLINRNLELFKADPTDEITEKRLDMGIKMAEIRFSEEYAIALRRAHDSAAGRRAENSA